MELTQYLLVTPAQYKKALEADNEKCNWQHSNQLCFSPREIERDDPALIQTIMELKDKACARFATLVIIEIPDGVEWEIEEYDGMEWVAEKHSTWG